MKTGKEIYQERLLEIVMEESGPYRQIFVALNSPIKLQIYKLCIKKNLNISQISKELSLSYVSTLHNLKALEQAGLIKKEERRTTNAKEIFITSVPIPELIKNKPDKFIVLCDKCHKQVHIKYRGDSN
jgi:predicted transcriptional regulator